MWGAAGGRIMNRLAALYPNSRFTGMDLSPEAIACARDEATEKRLQNIEFVTVDVSDFDTTAPSAAFENRITTFDAIHDQAKPLHVLQGIHRALRDDGVYLMQDIKGSSHMHNNIAHPLGTLLYTVSCMHCMTVSLAQGGEGLGAMWGEEKDARVPATRRIPRHRDTPTGPRHSEQLVCRQEVRPSAITGGKPCQHFHEPCAQQMTSLMP